MGIVFATKFKRMAANEAEPLVESMKHLEETPKKFLARKLGGGSHETS